MKRFGGVGSGVEGKREGEAEEARGKAPAALWAKTGDGQVGRASTWWVW